MSEHSSQQESAPAKKLPNAPHTKKYSYKENYDFVAQFWAKAAEKHPEFADYQADDLVNFFSKFQQLEDQKEYFESNMQRKRFEEIKATIFRKKYLVEARQLKKQKVPIEEILERIQKAVEPVLEKRQVERLLKNIRDY